MYICMYVYIANRLIPVPDVSLKLSRSNACLFAAFQDGLQRRSARLFYLLGTWANMALAVKLIEIVLGDMLLCSPV